MPVSRRLPKPKAPPAPAAPPPSAQHLQLVASREARARAEELAILKMESSGLEELDLAELRIEVLTGAESQGLHDSFRGLPALKLTYWDPRDLAKPLEPWPAWPGFYRLRYLREPGTEQKGDIRYINEPNAGVAAYFPCSVDWPTVLRDTDQTVLVTEGELKAAKACKAGFPCIGLGGVWNFKSTKLGVDFLGELEAFTWLKRRVYIVFDSDVKTKVGVQEALNALADELMIRGALPFIVFVPDGDGGKKQGLDDWMVANPSATIWDLCDRHQPLTHVRKLFELNERMIYVMDKGIIVDQLTAGKMGTNQFKEAYGNINYAELVLAENGAISLKKAPIAVSWLKWPLRSQVGTMTYKPGHPRLIEPDDHLRSAYNLWPGWGCEPSPGDHQPFLDLLNHLFKGADPGDLAWFLKWCAYPLQYPGTKLFTAAVIHGVKHGTGKSLIGYTLGKIYGKNFTEIDQNSLHNDFNTWAEAKQLVMGDDVTGSDKRQDNDTLKKLITQRELRVNTKFMPEYVVPDCVNYLFTSNHPDSFFLENDDRRFFIHEVLTTPMDEDFYMEYGLWLDTTGPAAVFDYLLQLDLGDFNPNAPALRTVAKDQMTADTRSDLSDWVFKLRSEPDDVLRVGGITVPGDLFTAKELLAIYDPEGTRRVTASGLGRELRRAALPRANRGVAIRGPQGMDRYYILRNANKWLDATRETLEVGLVKAAVAAGRKY